MKQAFFIFSHSKERGLQQRAVLYNSVEADEYAKKLSVTDGWASLFTYSKEHGVKVVNYREGYVFFEI